MTDAINFFQSNWMFKSLPPMMSLSAAEVKLAISLKKEARTLAAKGAEERHNGRTTQALASATSDPEKTRIFAEITNWHHGRAAEKYQKAASRFAEAGKIQIAKRKAYNLKAAEMTRRAAEAEAAVKWMNDFLKKLFNGNK